MSQDAASLVTRARSVLGRIERQRARFLDGRPGTARRGPWLGGKGSRTGGLNRRGETRKKEASGAREATSSCSHRHPRSGRPTWLCVPQCSRRSFVARNERSRRTLSVPSVRQPSRALVRTPSTRPPLDESDVESILLRDKEPEPAKPAAVRPPTPPCVLTCVSRDESNVSVNTFVAHQVQDIMERAAMNVVTMKSRVMDDGEEAARVKRLRRQISRTAMYTAVCRRLEHALHLYGETAPYRTPSRRPSLALSLSLYEPKAVRAQSYVAPQLTDLPKNTLLAIFSLLKQEDLALRVAPVCRQWRYLAHHRSLWRHLFLDWSAERDNGLARVPATCALLASIPGLWTLELVGCGNVDRLLWQVAHSCRRLRTLAVDSSVVSDNMRSSPHDFPCVLTELLSKCKVLHTLIVAFTPHLTKRSFFITLGSKCWSMRCFLVSADALQTRLFFESASWHAPGSKSRSAVGGARVAILHNRGANHLEGENVADGDAKGCSALLQWRLHRDHATATYYGINVRVGLSDSYSAERPPDDHDPRSRTFAATF